VKYCKRVSDKDFLQAVQEASAGLDYPLETPVHLVNVSHSTMCKFKTPDDVNYRTLRDRIQAEIQIKRMDLQTARQVQDSPQDPNITTLKQETITHLQSIRDQLAVGDARLERMQTGMHLASPLSFANCHVSSADHMLDQNLIALSATKAENGKSISNHVRVKED